MSNIDRFELIDGIKCYNPESAQEYNDYPSEGFDLTEKNEHASFWCRSRTRLLKQVINKYTYNKEGVQFLELGCGTGFFIRELAKDKRFEITGSDIYLGGLKYAKTKLPEADFVQIDATSNYMDKKFDIIGAFDVIEHIEDDEKVIENVARSLRDEGYFIVTVPQYKFLWTQLDEWVKHKRRYSRKELIAKLKSGGFEIVYQSSFIFTLFPLMMLSRLTSRRSVPVEDETKNVERLVKLSPVLNWLFDKVMYLDEYLIRLGFSLPFGGSLLVVARKIR